MTTSPQENTSKHNEDELRKAILKAGNVKAGMITFSQKIDSRGGVYESGIKSQDIVEIGIDDLMQLIHNYGVRCKLDELDSITKNTIDKPITPENQKDPTWQGGYRFAKNSLKRYKLGRIKQLQDSLGGE